MESSGKHAGKRRAEPAPQAPASEGGEPSGRSCAKLLPLALGVTLCVVAWGYLVYAAIDFGASARGGDTRAWWFLASPRSARWSASSSACCSSPG